MHTHTSFSCRCESCTVMCLFQQLFESMLCASQSLKCLIPNTPLSCDLTCCSTSSVGCSILYTYSGWWLSTVSLRYYIPVPVSMNCLHSTNFDGVSASASTHWATPLPIHGHTCPSLCIFASSSRPGSVACMCTLYLLFACVIVGHFNALHFSLESVS